MVPTVVKRGKTPVLAPEEARLLVDIIDVSTHAGLRDRALIGLMVYTFAQIDPSNQRIGMPYCRPPFVQSALRPRLIFSGEPSPMVRSKISP